MARISDYDNHGLDLRLRRLAVDDNDHNDDNNKGMARNDGPMAIDN